MECEAGISRHVPRLGCVAAAKSMGSLPPPAFVLTASNDWMRIYLDGIINGNECLSSSERLPEGRVCKAGGIERAQNGRNSP
jgi:hypothetical protein